MEFSTADDRYIYELVSKNIKYYRLHNNSKFSKYGKITQERLAELCDLSHSLISNIESAKVQQSFSLAVLYRISKVLEIDICKLFEVRDENGHLK
jgi:DNA-binding XRE family transcriptional regulator